MTEGTETEGTEITGQAQHGGTGTEGREITGQDQHGGAETRRAYWWASSTVLPVVALMLALATVTAVCKGLASNARRGVDCLT